MLLKEGTTPYLFLDLGDLVQGLEGATPLVCLEYF